MEFSVLLMTLSAQDRKKLQHVAFSRRLRHSIMQSCTLYYPRPVDEHKKLHRLHPAIAAFGKKVESIYESNRNMSLRDSMPVWLDSLTDIVGPDKFLWIAMTSDDHEFGGNLSTNHTIELRRKSIKKKC